MTGTHDIIAVHLRCRARQAAAACLMLIRHTSAPQPGIPEYPVHPYALAWARRIVITTKECE